MNRTEKKRIKLLNWNKRQSWPIGHTRLIGGHLHIKQINGETKAVHRILAEIHLKRMLLSIEVVHHKNHIKTDNRLDNFKLMLACQYNKLHQIR